MKTRGSVGSVGLAHPVCITKRASDCERYGQSSASAAILPADEVSTYVLEMHAGYLGAELKSVRRTSESVEQHYHYPPRTVRYITLQCRRAALPIFERRGSSFIKKEARRVYLHK